MRTLRHHFVVLSGLFLLCACVERERDSAELSTSAHPDQDDEAWATELAEHREEIDQFLGSSNTSPMAGTQYLKSEPGDQVYLTRQGKTFGLADLAGPDTVLQLARKQGVWHWSTEEQEIVCRIGDEVVAPGGALEKSATLELGDIFLRFHPSEDQVTFIVFDPEREEKKSFEHLLYFPPDRDLAVSAHLVPLAEPDKIEMLTSRDLKKTFYRYAKIQFQVDGLDQELTAFKYELTGEGSNALFIPFRDATTGRETYGAGRFLEIGEPKGESFVLDFNRAFNPLCNYSPAYNCAIPPRENHLKVAIRAGEMTYPH